MAAVAALLESAGEDDLRLSYCERLTATIVKAAWSMTPEQRRWLARALGPWAARIGMVLHRPRRLANGEWSLVLPVWVPETPGVAGWQVADLVAWPVGRPGAARSRSGATTVLGIDSAAAAQALHDGRPLRLRPDAAEWVRAGAGLMGAGLANPFDDHATPVVCVLDWASDDADWLLRMAPALIVADEDEAQALARRRDAWRTRQRPPKTRILIARAAPEERAA